MILTITVPGSLRGKGRPRFGNGRTFTDAKTQNAEAWVKHCAIQQVGQPCLEGPLRLGIDIAVEVPMSWSKKKRADALANVIKPTGKPDLDNSAKLAADSLNGIVWKDDSQFVELRVSRRYAEVAQAVLTVMAA